MRCKITRTCYMLMVRYRVAEDDDDGVDGFMTTPVLRNVPGFDPMQPLMTDQMEASCYITKEDAESHRQQWADRFPQAVYSIVEVTPR